MSTIQLLRELSYFTWLFATYHWS